MRGRHEEGPEHETDLTGSHANAHAVAVTIELVIDRPTDEQQTATGEKQILRHHYARDDDCSRDDGDRQRMAERDRRQRPKDGRPAIAMQTESDGEQPSHRRVETVKGTEPGHHEPRPQLL